MNLIKPGIYENELFPCSVVLVENHSISQQRSLKFNKLFGTGAYMVIVNMTFEIAAIVQNGLACADNKKLVMQKVVALVRMDNFRNGKPTNENFLKELNQQYSTFMKTFEWEMKIAELFPQPVEDIEIPVPFHVND